MDDKKRKEIEKRETPLIDGDARPDQLPDPDYEKPKNLVENQERDVTINRGADVNSLEDYRDEK